METDPNALVASRQRALLPYRGPVAVAEIRDALVIREGRSFLLTDRDGNIPFGNRKGFGFYHLDTRHLSGYDFSFLNVKPTILLSTAEAGFRQEQVLTNPPMVGAGGRQLERETVEVHRTRNISAAQLQETARITNYNVFSVTLDLLYRFQADFVDVFEIRGVPRRSRGRLVPPRLEDGRRIVYGYLGLDGRLRQTRITFDPTPLELTTERALVRVTLGRRESITLHLTIEAEGGHEELPTRRAPTEIPASYEEWSAGSAEVYTSDEILNAAIERSLADLRVLWATDLDDCHYPAAGTPWYDAFFGRDSAITSLQSLAFRPEIARAVLLAMATHQGCEVVPERDEEPGKVPHERRWGEMSLCGEVPFAAYYGSIDATPLFLVLAAEYYAWTADLDLMRQLEPNLRRALEWIQRYGDLDGDGYVEYEKRSPQGLVNQGWKDSADAIVHRDGTLVTPPIALAEVQGYVYAAQRQMATVFADLGDEELARRLLAEASQLQRRFNRDFWMPRERFYALALDGEKRRAASIASNAGQALWSGIVSPARAPRVVERLMQSDMFSGWGVRTLSAASPRYNPNGYHLGTVWPHDNSLIIAGFRRYGCDQEAGTLAEALLRAARSFDYFRLPELLSGAPRAPYQPPIPYPVACKPQAWAAGSTLLALTALLGLRPDTRRDTLYVVRPYLPDWLDFVRLRRLRIGSHTADLEFRRGPRGTEWSVGDKSPGLRVRRLSRWP